METYCSFLFIIIPVSGQFFHNFIGNIAGCQQTLRSSDSRLSPDFLGVTATRPKSLLTAGCHQNSPKKISSSSKLHALQ